MVNLVIRSSVLLAMFAGLPISAQTAPAASGAPSTSHVQAQLLNSVKAAKAKANDPVRAQTMTPLALADGTVIPVGSTLSGHVVKVEPDSPDGHTSSLAIAFDSVELKKHETQPLKLSIASAMAQTATGMANNTYQTATRSGNGVADSHALNGQAYSVKDDNTDLMIGGSAKPGQGVAAHSGSVIGLPGVTLMVEDGPNAVSTFISAKKNLQLDSGLQMILVVAPQ